MKTRIMSLLAFTALAMPAAALSAEIPQRGQTESQVRSQFGAPGSTKGPVGTPAITRWNYDGFTVYFENGVTLHTVVDRPAKQAPDVVSGPQSLPPIEENSETPATAPAAEPETQTAEQPTGDMTFDPISGRFVPADGSQPAEDSPEAPEASSAPAETAEEITEEDVQAAEPVEDQAEPVDAAPAASEMADSPESEPQPAPEPQPEPEPTPAPQESVQAPAETGSKAPSPSDSEFRFDPVTGRIIIAGEETPEQAAAKAEAAAEQKAQKEKAETESKLREAEAEVKAAAGESAEEVREAAEAASDAAEDASEEAAEEGGFHIDWGNAQ